ncbi:hypothetical protein [Nocardia blacklockiae]|uniref:hypothetical protein n=1 Tax=Nocardia blacklockiae TaxID=480036 RepID=UPI00189519FC|nr:hypothetical protein [Nocardia blacklockiae]MBF6175375.1 hypothetical protein [Nocardia blacklockiae]
MKLHFLLHRRQADSVPLLPVSDSEELTTATGPGGGNTRRKAAEREERLERLLTPTELDLVQQHRL